MGHICILVGSTTSVRADVMLLFIVTFRQIYHMYVWTYRI